MTFPNIRHVFSAALAAAAVLAASSCDLGTPIKASSPTEVEGLTGTLVGPDGAPVSGAWVKVYATPAAATAKTVSWTTAGLTASGTALDSVRTGSNGTYDMAGLADGTYNLAASVQRNDTTLALFLRDIAVTGRTNLGVDTLRASGDLIVHLASGGSSLVGALCFITASPWTSVSDAEGDCKLVEVPPGEFRVSVSYSGGVVIEFGDLVVTSGGATLDSVIVPLPQPDAVPTLLSPAANATGVSASSANFSWMGVESALYYRLQIATDSLFTNRTVDDTASASVTAGAMSRHASGLADGTGYFWRVVAVKANQTTISAWRWFSTSVVKPPDPVPSNSVSVLALQDAEILAPAATQAASGMHDNSNFGKSPDIGVGVYDINTVARGLVQFRIPAGFQASDIKRAVIRLQVSRWITKNVHPDSVRIRAHELLRSWKEGSGASTDGTPNSASIDGATGRERFWGSQNENENWNQRLVGLDGIDAAPTPISEVAHANGYIGSWEFDVTDLARKWATDSSSSFGVVFLTDVPESNSVVEDYPIFHSKDGSVPDAYKPQLILMPAGTVPDTAAVTDSAPSPVSPAANATVNYSATSVSWTHVTGATKYRVQLARDSAFLQMARDTTVSDSVLPLFNLSEGAVYYWRVRAENASGNGPYSATRKFTTTLFQDVVLIAAPRLFAPAESASTSLTPTLSWSKVAGATMYQVQVSTTGSFVGALAVNDTASLDTSKTLSSPLTAGTVHYWRVRGIATGMTGAWSSSRSFRTSGTAPTDTTSTPPPVEPIAAPGLQAPANNATGLPANSIGFSWMADSVSYYRLQIASDTTFSSLQVNDSVPASTVAGPMTHDAGPFAQGTTYAWRVIAVKGGSQRASAARWFTTGSIVIPVDGDPEPLP